MIGPATFRFLNVEGRIDTGADWQSPDRPALWSYNLHYFDDLSATDAPARVEWHRELIRRWIAENPPAAGIGWDSYPASLRIVNWIKWLAERPADMDAAIAGSLAIQVRFLRRRLETHLLGNHLWANAKALVFAGAFFEGEEAEIWLREGVALIERELREQILTDGGHFERSPMYHAILLEDVIDLLGAVRMIGRGDLAGLERQLEQTARAMMRWLSVMTHPDGRIAFFNDASFGIAADCADLVSYGARLGIDAAPRSTRPIELLAASGYARLEAGRAVVLCDVAPIGPDYLPGHAHADTLSFEMSLDGHRVIVNGGTSTYAVGDRRHRERATAAHNTVVVNDTDSSEVWGSFRVGRRARVSGVSSGVDDRGLWLEASHDGYRHLGAGMHTRRWSLGAGSLTIADALSGEPRSATARLHLHPAFAAELTADGLRVTAPPRAPLSLYHARAGAVRLERGEWSPAFGQIVPNTCVVAAMERALETRVQWE